MFRTLSIVAMVLILAACGDKTVGDSAAVPAGSADVTFMGASYDLVGVGECGARPDRTYSTWAFTLDADGEPVLDGPQLHALSEDDWSVIDFYSGKGDDVVRIYRDGPEKLQFTDGVLQFEGELGAGLTEHAQVTITCPD